MFYTVVAAMRGSRRESGKSNIPNIVLLSTVCVLLGFSYFMASDMYVPSLPNMSKELLASSSMARMTIAVFLVALAVSQLFYGPASDKLGRKKIILMGAAIYLLGSLLCMTAGNINILLLGRVIQGVGVGALLPLSRVIVQDSVSKEKFIHIVGWLSLFFMLAPASAPVIGGLIETYASWRVNFIVMFLFVLVVAVVVIFFLPETHAKALRNPDALKPAHLLKNYTEIITHVPFVIYTFCMIAGFSGIVAFYTIGPFILIQQYGMSPKAFGFCSLLIIAVAFIARLYMSLFSLKKFGITVTLLQGLSVMLAASVLLLICALFGLAGQKMLLISVGLYAMGSSMVGPTVVGVALSLFKHKSGFAGAVYGFLQMFGLFVVSLIAAMVKPAIISYAMIVFVMSVMSFGLFVWLSIRGMKQSNLDVEV